MKSHSCNFNPEALISLVTLTLFPVALFAIAMHSGANLNLLPAPRPALDAERTVIVNKVEAARTVQDSSMLLIGDSSCMMNLSASQLGNALRVKALNLATFSYLDLHTHGKILGEFTRANPSRLQFVVLLLHPETLRRSGADDYYAEVSSSFIAGHEPPAGRKFSDQARHWLGAEIFQERILSRALPIPLRGAFARRYGFTTDLDATLNRNLGSLIDPDTPQPLNGRPEYRLAPALEKASAAFRKSIPHDVRLFVGITPVAEKLSENNYQQWRDASLIRWSQWLTPATALTNLPATLPDDQFTRSTHLRESAVPKYTATLANVLKGLLPR